MKNLKKIPPFLQWKVMKIIKTKNENIRNQMLHFHVPEIIQ